MSSCNPKLTLEEKEIAILRDAIDIAEQKRVKKLSVTLMLKNNSYFRRFS